MKLLLRFLAVFICVIPFLDAAKILVTTNGELWTALKNASPGDRVILEDGTYTNNPTVDVEATWENPLVITARNPLKAVMQGTLTVRGSHIVISGLFFNGPLARMSLYGDHHRVIGNKFKGWATTSPAVFPGLGMGCEIAYNEFTEPDPFTTIIEHSSYPLRIGIRSSDSINFHSAAWVHHNWFHDFPPKPDPNNYHSGQSDAIEVCYTGSDKVSGWIIEHNLLENHHGTSAIIDIKCSAGILVQFNTVINSPEGRIDFRNGDGGRMIANWIENSGGMAISGEDHEVAHNHITGSGSIFALTTGTDALGLVSGRKAASNNLLVCNTGPLSIGRWDGAFKALNNVVKGHTGSLSLLNEENTVIDNDYVCDDSSPSPYRLERHDVGPQAHWKDRLDVQLEASIPAEADATIFMDSDNAAGQGTLWIGESSEGLSRRALVRFDLSNLPTNAVILEARLSLVVKAFPGNDLSVQVHRLLSSWSEGSTLDNSGVGKAPASNDVTWRYRRFPDLPWGSPGGDFDSDTSATWQYTAGDTPDNPIHLAGPELAQDVQDWLTRPDLNFGWILVSGTVGKSAELALADLTARSSNSFPHLFLDYSLVNLPAWRGLTAINPSGDLHDSATLGWLNVADQPWLYLYQFRSWAYSHDDWAYPHGCWLHLPQGPFQVESQDRLALESLDQTWVDAGPDWNWWFVHDSSWIWSYLAGRWWYRDSGSPSANFYFVISHSS